MINQASVRAVEGARWNPHFIKPLYDTYCFSQLTDLVTSAFSGEETDAQTRLLGPLAGRYDRVVLLFIDAFGWRFFERYADKFSFLSRFVNEGYINKITSQFPSTTAAHVTNIHTGMPVGESGVFEWFYYEPVVDAMIAPLLFSFAGDTGRTTLLTAGIQPLDIFPFPGHTLYNRLGRLGVRSTVFQSTLFTPSPHSSVAFEGADVVPFPDLRQGLQSMVERIGVDSTPSYYFLYFDGIDGAGHHYGPDSEEFGQRVATAMALLEDFVEGIMSGQGRTLLMMTADHGQTNTTPDTTVYLNKAMPGIERYIRTNRKGQLLVPGGSARDLFLYIKDEYVDEAHAALSGLLEGKAEVYRVEDLVEQGFFGKPSARLLERLSQLVVLPYEGEGVFWYEKGRFEQPFWGHHGGLTRDEMETILLVMRNA
jgi:hypothetical protein